jgi:hypothetical protein
MSEPKVIGLNGIGLEVPEAATAEKFYGTFGLEARPRAGAIGFGSPPPLLHHPPRRRGGVRGQAEEARPQERIGAGTAARALVPGSVGHMDQPVPGFISL